jgi:DNA-binding XRE family transcriptional regulator
MYTVVVHHKYRRTRMKAFDLKSLRAQKDVQQRELAASVECHPNTLIDIERGRIGIDSETHGEMIAAINRIAEAKKREGVPA